MIKEAYCSYEISKLLKEKGFDEPCFAYYEDDGNFRQSWSNHAIQNKTNPCFFGNAAPTHQMACAWLRERHIIIIVKPLYFDVEYYVSRWGYNIWADDNLEVNSENCSKPLASYEEATEEALKCVLENLL